ncbi:hypothetical protein PAM_412 [Onion yellows phytoplasma OY-M]|uniref:Uncharacterized protein n=1 Tax=Onion yellows phytoplasma (strain OY-M) TaxID=262768 RepID=Q6YQG1_ONYPE|nr:hypothetical protein PAM_412 [Onion yellows phytoplasma OY-M]
MNTSDFFKKNLAIIIIFLFGIFIIVGFYHQRNNSKLNNETLSQLEPKSEESKPLKNKSDIKPFEIEKNVIKQIIEITSCLNITKEEKGFFNKELLPIMEKNDFSL